MFMALCAIEESFESTAYVSINIRIPFKPYNLFSAKGIDTFLFLNFRMSSSSGRDFKKM